MPKKPIVSVEGLKRAAVTYQALLRLLPYEVFAQVAARSKIVVVEVDNEDVIHNKRRGANVMGAYVPGMEIKNQEDLVRFVSMSLKPELVYCSMVDNINNYSDKKVISNAGEPVNHKTKKHPLEAMIVKDQVISFLEDVSYSMFFSERDEAVASPLTAFNGFFTKINAAVTGGLIAADQGNLKTTGAFAMPTNDTDTAAYSKLVEFVGSANNFLRRNCELRISEDVFRAARAAYKNKCKSFADPSNAQFLEALKSDAFVTNMDVIADPTYGKGSKLLLTAPKLLEFGQASNNAGSFVQVRDPFPDPNDVQFWIQSAYDTRINDIHSKVFQTNEQQNTHLDLAGDYVRTVGTAPGA